MGRKANPALVGAFVVGAIALAVVGLVVFGSGQMFKHTFKFVCFFPGAVDGLNIGAPVKFKGVEIGSVTDIRLRLEGQKAVDALQVSQGVRIPVMIEIDNDKLVGRGTKGLQDPGRLKHTIDLGLRAQLASQSLVTGLLFVQLDFKPDTEATLVLPPDSELREIPTIPTSMEQIQSAAQQIIHKLEDMHFEELVKSATETVDGINKVVNSPGLQRTIEALPETVANINQAVTSLRDLTVSLDHKEGPLLESVKVTSDKTGAALEQARATLQSLQALIDPNAPLANRLISSLQEISDAARSVRLLADYLERNPSAVVRGKEVPEK